MDFAVIPLIFETIKYVDSQEKLMSFILLLGTVSFFIYYNKKNSNLEKIDDLEDKIEELEQEVDKCDHK